MKTGTGPSQRVVTVSGGPGKYDDESAVARLLRAGCEVHRLGSRQKYRVLLPQEGVGIGSWGAVDFLSSRGHRIARL